MVFLSKGKIHRSTWHLIMLLNNNCQVKPFLKKMNAILKESVITFLWLEMFHTPYILEGQRY